MTQNGLLDREPPTSEIESRFRDTAKQPPLRCRLNYKSALTAHLRGACAAKVAIAAGSRAKSRRNLRRVGLKIIRRIKSRCDVFETFNSLGFTLTDFCRGVIEAARATKIQRYYRRGKLIGEITVPDWRARNAAGWLYLEATGALKLPLEPPSWEQESEER